MPRLSVVAGPSLDALVPISVNSGIPNNIVSDAFEGQILAYVKGFTDEEGNVLQNEYFQREERRGITWSIQTQGNVIRLNPCPPYPHHVVLTKRGRMNRTFPSPYICR